MIKKRSKRFLVILVSLTGSCILMVLLWQVINVIHVMRRGVPLELYQFFRTKKLVDNINRLDFLKAEGRDADYVYLFEYNDEAAQIIEETEKSGKWRAFPVSPEVLQQEKGHYSGLCGIESGWACFVDELPISEEDFNGYWTLFIE